MDSGEINIAISTSWEIFLHDELAKPYFVKLRESMSDAYRSGPVFPSAQNIFRAFELCAPDDVKVVILGQDPYHTPGVADGLAFSSFPQNPIPPSLKNIYKEIENEFGYTCEPTPDLSRFASQGVLLLNASLTVQSGLANSHALFGWHTFTNAVISIISRECEHVVFVLWGNYAREKRTLIDGTKHLILESPHPSPLSAHRGFFGNGHFKKANEYLKRHGKREIVWC